MRHINRITGQKFSSIECGPPLESTIPSLHEAIVQELRNILVGIKSSVDLIDDPNDWYGFNADSYTVIVRRFRDRFLQFINFPYTNTGSKLSLNDLGIVGRFHGMPRRITSKIPFCNGASSRSLLTLDKNNSFEYVLPFPKEFVEVQTGRLPVSCTTVSAGEQMYSTEMPEYFPLNEMSKKAKEEAIDLFTFYNSPDCF